MDCPACGMDCGDWLLRCPKCSTVLQANQDRYEEGQICKTTNNAIKHKMDWWALLSFFVVWYIMNFMLLIIFYNMDDWKKMYLKVCIALLFGIIATIIAFPFIYIKSKNPRNQRSVGGSHYSKAITIGAYGGWVAAAWLALSTITIGTFRGTVILELLFIISLSYGLYRKSRLSAIALFLYLIINASISDGIGYSDKIAIFAITAWYGFVGTMQYHKHIHKENSAD